MWAKALRAEGGAVRAVWAEGVWACIGGRRARVEARRQGGDSGRGVRAVMA